MRGASYSSLSRDSALALPTEKLASSVAAGWTSLLLEHHGGRDRCEPFETLPTPDQTLVVAMRGEHEVSVYRQGRWRSALYRPGVGGMTPGEQTSRIRWSGRHAGEPFSTAHLYLPQHHFQAVADHYRRIGQRVPTEPLSALAFNDPAVSQVVVSLLDAMAAGAPDLLADAAAAWIAAHLLSHRGEWRHLADDDRHPGLLDDRRIARVVEYMSTHLSQPLTLDRLAAEACVSRFHFVRLFRGKVGATPHAYLLRLRIEAAKTALATTDLPVAQIASDCGYPRPANFAAAFARSVGMAPTAYRRQARR